MRCGANRILKPKYSTILKPSLRHSISKEKILLYGIVLLLLPALLIHLGLGAFTDDEGIRALVALEMSISGNYISPTMFGEPYLNKPPLYNWILLAVYQLTGRNDEFISRLPTLFFLLAYAASVYWFFRKNLLQSEVISLQSTVHSLQSAGSKLRTGDCGLWTALALITCGRILFWDSMLGLIDICFSWVIFCLFMVIYQEGEKGRYGRLYVLAYLLAAIGFLLKALPSVVFLGLALPLYFIWQKKWRRLFTWAHVGGMAVFAAVVGSYYLLYARENGLANIAETIFQESAKRTFVEYGWWDTVLHLFTFPFEMWYHFLPWTLLAVYFFTKNAWRHIRQNKFITWNLLVFLVTILPYWSSVEVYPRYLFMHVPLVFSAFFYLHFIHQKNQSKVWQAVEKTFMVLCLVTSVGSLYPLVWPAVQELPYLYVKTAVVTGSLALLTYFYWRWKAQRMLLFVMVLLVLRIGFNWFVLPTRLEVDCKNYVRETTNAAVKKLDGQPLYVYQHSLGNQPITGYYYTRETGRILRVLHHDFDKNAFYLVNTDNYPKEDFEQLTTMRVSWECGEVLIGKLKE